MKKQRIIVEYELKSNSPAIIWRHLSTAEGLARWIADEVEMDENTVTLAWGNPLMHYDSRKLDILERTKNSCMRMRWVDEDDPEAYLEMRMEKSEKAMKNVTQFQFLSTFGQTGEYLKLEIKVEDL